MCEQRIADEEIVYLRIPNSSDWFEPPDRISTGNFRLKHDDLGLSVYRDKVVTPDDVRAKPGATPGCLIAAATVGKIRGLTDGTGKPLCLDVIAVDDKEDPGHSEIREPVPGNLRRAASKALRSLFKRI